MIEFKLPSLGADMDEGTLLEWRVAPGQAVKKGDVVAVVDTSKAAIDVETWVEGTVQELLVKVGQKMPVGTVMAWLRAPGEAEGAAVVPGAPAAAPAAPVAAVVAPPPPAGTTRMPVSPAARRRAAELGLALEGITGSGADGAVTLADVERAAHAPAPAAAPATDRAAEMRKVIAAAMARSKREIPHYYLAEPVPMRAALEWLRTYNEALPVTHRLLPAVLLLKAVALALRAVPELNGVFVDGAFRPSEAVHLGVAISLRRGGLIAPALHAADTKPLAQLMAELADLVQRARAGSLRSSELADPTVTVTNLGDQGVESVAGVIYPPQVALIGFGRIAERAWVEDGRVVALPVLTASLAADHRVSDGHRGALFLARLRDQLQRPHEL
ncbi:dihydrolipoamide acetyltransferase family protein [Piscinibacter defluvii]|uniref:dihydrolipoamide acetyltransferase family protein n=1 Tax=Piscinibacter defluvii TaxID=1796922 RepID=UPI000FDE7570|nr:dihydrolipoamide acetyltransferase family protein [Piscinibacter defluvii]